MHRYTQPIAWVASALREGMVIPAHPLALNASRQIDVDRQAGLARYFHSAGAGGVAIGVHTTQFAIRLPQHDLLKQVLSIGADTIRQCDKETDRQSVLVAGVCGETKQAIAEARLASELGYHAALLSVADYRNAPNEAILNHARSVASEIPLIGFYLQPAVGGRILSFDFWRAFSEIPNVLAIKIAPFNRYQTLDVVRAVAASSRVDEIALYTGNDDNIVVDLITEFRVQVDEKEVCLKFAGGLLGHWACWTRSAVTLWKRCLKERETGVISSELLSIAQQITDANAAIFDAANQYRGCIAGIHEALRRDGLLDGIWCLDPLEELSPGQAESIDRVCQAYPEWTLP
ncbi:MAG: dihydrodipicolinate synthase family protein [Pirellulaceae bacterium]|nr:dihydrodipicolinate synthase family protein [Pirellulaceae bacterium]